MKHVKKILNHSPLCRCHTCRSFAYQADRMRLLPEDHGTPKALSIYCRCSICREVLGRKKAKARLANHFLGKQNAIKERLQWYRTLKANPCIDCGRSFPPEAMDFDHRDPKQKRDEISRMIKQSRSLELISKELDRCDLVCACCHRIRETERRHKKDEERLAKRRIEAMGPSDWQPLIVNKEGRNGTTWNPTNLQQTL